MSLTPLEWPTAQRLETRRLRLEPLRPDHASEMAAALDDPGLHTFIGGSPATERELRERYARWVVGGSADGSEGWLNWIISLTSTGEPVGTVQATVRRVGRHLRAEVAWVVVSARQGQGIATEAAAAMVGWLGSRDVDEIAALIHPDHVASAKVAARLGLRATDEMVDGEVRWISDATESRLGEEPGGCPTLSP